MSSEKSADASAEAWGNLFRCRTVNYEHIMNIRSTSYDHAIYSKGTLDPQLKSAVEDKGIESIRATIAWFERKEISYRTRKGNHIRDVILSQRCKYIVEMIERDMLEIIPEEDLAKKTYLPRRPQKITDTPRVWKFKPFHLI